MNWRAREIASTAWTFFRMRPKSRSFALTSAPIWIMESRRCSAHCVAGNMTAFCCSMCLEHLKNPEQILRQSRAAVRTDGLLIVSVPNVANITVRLALLFGRFNYQERGILDRTHLRFFTRRTARAMMKAEQYEILEERTSIMPLELILGLAPENPLLRAMNLMLAAGDASLPRPARIPDHSGGAPASGKAGARP